MRMTMFLAIAACAGFSQPESRKPAEIKLQSVIIDADAKTSVSALRVDTMGRLFAGASDGLFVYEPKDGGGYQARKLLYRFPKRTSIQDIEFRGDDLFVLTESALYRFDLSVRKRDESKPSKLLWGVPGGKPGAGFRKMAWGPDGDLYFTIGGLVPEDRWCYWTFFDIEGKRTPYRGVGGIFRCKPDGTGVRVVADGLHDARHLTFDRYWNLFTGDSPPNNTFQLWHVPPHLRLDARALPPAFHEKMGSLQCGPLYYDDPLLPEKFRRRLWITWGPSYSGFALEPRGASFKAVHDAYILNENTNAMSIGRGGRIFAWNTRIEMLTKPDDAAGQPFEPYEASGTTSEKLWKELSNPSWHRRYRAHVEIMRRGGDLLKEANRKLRDVKRDDPALHHLIWLAAKSGQGNIHLLGMNGHADTKVRVQTIRALTEFPAQLLDEPIFTKSLLDDDPHVRLAAVSAYFEPKIGFSYAVQQTIERGPARDADPYLRQPACLLLASKATFKQIEAMCGSVDEARRLAGVLAAGYRLTLPPTTPIASHLPLRLGNNGDPHTEIEYADGKRDLRDEGRVGTFTIAEHWKADMHTEEQNRLFNLLRKLLDDQDAAVRVQAARFLAVLDDARCAKDVQRVLKNEPRTK